MRRLLHLGIVLALLAGLGAPLTGRGLAAQERNDQSRLSVGVGIGYNGGSDLWSVRGQPIFGTFGSDTADLSRIIRPTIGISFLGVYYPDARYGLSMEIHLIGLGYEDRCHLTTNSGDVDVPLICTNLNGKQSPGTAIAATVGGIVRPFPWASFQPYLRGNAGLVVSEQSAIRMTATYLSPTDTTQFHDYPVYTDGHPASISPTAAFALGATGFVGRSYQLRAEVKDNMVILKSVEGTTAYEAREPAWQQKVHHIVTLTVGMEVVLEKRRGRRY
jgi:hypothetical protein